MVTASPFLTVMMFGLGSQISIASPGIKSERASPTYHNSIYLLPFIVPRD